jgi:DNA-binding CsgD family transcriptional regulator
MKNHIKLTLLETLYLRWTAQGKSLSEIAAIEGGDPADIQSHLDSATLTLGARSIPDATEKAKFLNMI